MTRSRAVRALKTTVLTLAIAGALIPAGRASDVKMIVDNPRVTVWDVSWDKGQPNPLPKHANDYVTVYLKPPADGKGVPAMYSPKGTAAGEDGTRSIVIELKDNKVAPLENKSGYPNAFPRPHVKKVLENDEVIVWDYTWLPNEATPMHFHDKDVVVVYFDEGSLQSTTPDGKKVVNEYHYGLTKFNPRDRTHTELLIKGKQHAVMTELK